MLRQPCGLIRAFFKIASHAPTRAAINDHGSIVSYAALASKTRRLAAWLARAGLAPGDMVGITVTDGYRHYVLSLALMRLGCVQVTMASHEPEMLRAELARRCRITCLVVERPEYSLADIHSIVPDFETADEDFTLDSDPLAPVDDDRCTIVLASSGTTGKAKLVPLTQRQLLAQTRPGASGVQTAYRPTSIEFNSAKRTGLINLGLGWTNVLCEPSSAAIPDIVRQFGITMLNLSPHRIRTLLDTLDGQDRALDGITLSVGGSPVGGALRKEIQARISHDLHVVYGATECGVITVAPPHMHSICPDTVGFPIGGVQVEIVDDQGRPLPENEIGRIRVRGAGVSGAYFDDDALGAQAFRDGYYYPGDLGSMTAEGALNFHGRADDMMILNTINVFPSEIENVADTFPGIAECAAFRRLSAVHGEIPMLAVVSADKIDLQEMQAYCRSRLGIKAPRKIVRVESLPRNAAGKVLRSELERQFAPTSA